MNRIPKNHSVQDENEFGKSNRGNNAQQSTKQTNAIVLDSDVLKFFPDQHSVNEALRSLIPDIERHLKKLDETSAIVEDFYISYCQKQRETQRKAIRLFKWSLIGLFVGGSVIYLLTFFINFKNNIIADITRLAGPLISIISALPSFFQIIHRRERLNKYQQLIEGLEKEKNKNSKEYFELVEIVKDDFRKI